MNKRIEEIVSKIGSTQRNGKLRLDEYIQISKIIYSEIEENKRFKYLALRDALCLDVNLTVSNGNNLDTFRERRMKQVKLSLDDEEEDK